MTSSARSGIRLRADLELSWQTHQGATVVVVKDPVMRRYFRFKGPQATIVGMMSEPVDAETVAAAISETVGGTVPAETIGRFFELLESKLLVDTPQVREELASDNDRKAKKRNLLYWRLAAINPERLFAWLVPRTRFAFRPAFHVFAAFTILCGVAILVTNWESLAADAPRLLNSYGLLLVIPVIFSVITIHELSHGLTCCHFGGKVHEVGFMLIYFQPAFYCDVSDSWLFPSKWRRIWVAFAGGYAQFIVWGLCAIVWRITDTDTLINQAALTVVLFSGLQSLVNFNPLIKLDGYYMLSDYLEIPNLRAKATRTVWDWVSVSGRPATRGPGFRAQFIYGAAAIAFSTVLLFYVYSTLYAWATARYQLMGLVGFGVFLMVTLRRTTSELIAGFRAVAARVWRRRRRSLLIAALLALVALAGRWELKIPAEFRVLAKSEEAARADTDGIVVEVLVEEGRAVQKGDILARLRDVDFDKREKASELSGLLAEKRSQLTLLMAGPRAEEIDRKRRAVDTQRTALANAKRAFEQSKPQEQTLARKKAELALAEKELKRARQLSVHGLISAAEIARAESAVEVHRSDVAETDTSIAATQETIEREILLKAMQLEEAESDLRLTMAGTRQEEIQRQRAEIATLETQLALFQRRLATTDIVAPIDGVVSTPHVEHKLNQSLTAGEEFCRIVDTRRVTVEMQVPEKELADVQPHNAVQMKAHTLPGKDIQGLVDFIAPVAQTVDNNRHMVVVRSEIQNASGILRPEMTGVAKIYCGKRPIAELALRRVWSWVRTEFWDLLP